MGRGSNGNAGSGRPRNSKGTSLDAMEQKDKEARRDTEAGMTPEGARKILAAELKTKDLSYETLQVFDANGNLIAANMNGGKGSAAIPEKGKIPDVIVTHNHPRQLSYSRFANIGLGHTGADLWNMVHYNFAEFRAVTNGYIFSMRRPKGGFKAGLNGKEVYLYMNQRFNTSVSDIDKRYDKLVSEKKMGYMDSLKHRERERIWLVNDILKDVSRRFGFIYTRRKI